MQLLAMLASVIIFMRIKATTVVQCKNSSLFWSTARSVARIKNSFIQYSFVICGVNGSE